MEALPQEALKEMMANLLKFLLLKYRAKELTSRTEMLDMTLTDNQDQYLWSSVKPPSACNWSLAWQ